MQQNPPIQEPSADSAEEAATPAMGDYFMSMETPFSFTFDDNSSDCEGNCTEEGNYTEEEAGVCPDAERGGPEGGVRRLLAPAVFLLIFALGGLGNLLVLVILRRYRRRRTSTELFLFHLALANLLLVLTFPFGVAESLAGWLFGTALCKALSAAHRATFYSSSLLLGCVSVDRYLAVVHAVRTFRRRRALPAAHLACLAVWLLALLLALPDLLFAEVWAPGGGGGGGGGEPLRRRCYFQEYGPHGFNAWLATRFLYHTVGFFLPSAVMGYCYAAVVRALCRSPPRLQRQKAVKVAVLVTGVFLLCWSPYHVVIFWDTLAKLGAAAAWCALRDGLGTAIVATEMVAFSHCCLNPLLYAFVGARFRQDALRALRDLGCLRRRRGALGERPPPPGACRTESSTTETHLSVVGRLPPAAPPAAAPAPASGSPPRGPADPWPPRQEGGDSDE